MAYSDAYLCQTMHCNVESCKRFNQNTQTDNFRVFARDVDDVWSSLLKPIQPEGKTMLKSTSSAYCTKLFLCNRSLLHETLSYLVCCCVSCCDSNWIACCQAWPQQRCQGLWYVWKQEFLQSVRFLWRLQTYLCTCPDSVSYFLLPTVCLIYVCVIRQDK